MLNYDSFAPVYDLAMGDQKEIALAIKRLVKRHAPKARTLLELGCGSGSLLKILCRDYTASGIDLSAGMIRIAKKKVPQADLHVGDISIKSLRKKFDVVICAFDTINHIPQFSSWQQVFRRAREHLNPEGVFIFDINTQYKIERYHRESPYIEIEDRAVSIFEVKMKSATRYSLTVRVFKKERPTRFTLHQMVVNGATFPVERIRKALLKQFAHVSLVDIERKKASSRSEELYFVCTEPRRRRRSRNL